MFNDVFNHMLFTQITNNICSIFTSNKDFNLGEKVLLAIFIRCYQMKIRIIFFFVGQKFCQRTFHRANRDICGYICTHLRFHPILNKYLLPDQLRTHHPILLHFGNLAHLPAIFCLHPLFYRLFLLKRCILDTIYY
jgi:hypothetical protein